MRYLMHWIGNFLREEDGHATVEYAVNIGLIAMFLASYMPNLSGNAKKTFNTVSDTLKLSGS